MRGTLENHISPVNNWGIRTERQPKVKAAGDELQAAMNRIVV